MELDTPEKKYQIIYADPPWKFEAYSSEKGLARSPQAHYKCMDGKDIMGMPISKLTDENCILFLWAVKPMLPLALDVMEAWGFEYKTVAFTWVKKNKKSSGFFTGLGYWTRSNPEICLLGTKGSIKRTDANVKEMVISRLRRHSQKPDIVRKMIVALCGDLPRVELFARQRFEGWDVWGDESPKEIQTTLRGD